MEIYLKDNFGIKQCMVNGDNSDSFPFWKALGYIRLQETGKLAKRIDGEKGFIYPEGKQPYFIFSLAQ